MLKTQLSVQGCLNGFRLGKVLPPLTAGIALLALVGKPVEARPLGMASPLPSTIIYGSPIPAPVPVNPITAEPDFVFPYDYRVNDPFRTPVRGVIQNSTLINPTVINSTIVDSVLVNPVIVNSPSFPRRVFGRFYNPPGSLRIQIGY
jgi:hypothetical protein